MLLEGLGCTDDSLRALQHSVHGHLLYTCPAPCVYCEHVQITLTGWLQQNNHMGTFFRSGLQKTLCVSLRLLTGSTQAFEIEH